MPQRNQDIYASLPLQRLLGDQLCVVARDLKRNAGNHGLWISAAPEDRPEPLPLLGCWTRLGLRDRRQYQGDVLASSEEPLPFVDDAFELVVLRHALEVVVDPQAWLRDVLRVLAPGGLLMITGIHPLSAWAPWFCWRTRRSHGTPRWPLSLQSSLQQAGMEIERMQRVGTVWPAVPALLAVRSGSAGGGYVLMARKRRRGVTPVRIKTQPLVVPSHGQLPAANRRRSAS